MPEMKYAKKRTKPGTGVKTKYIPQKKRKTKKNTPSIMGKARQRRQGTRSSAFVRGMAAIDRGMSRFLTGQVAPTNVQKAYNKAGGK
jgi:hypothetical protein